MKIIRYEKDGVQRYGELQGDIAYPLHDAIFQGIVRTGEAMALRDVRLVCPVFPSKVLAIGFNYRDHAEEFRKPIPKEPNVFMKPGSCLIGPGEPVLLPREMSRRVEHECELVVVLGRRARHIARENALDYVFGYTCGNDVTARDMQRMDNQWSLCKGFDTFGPVGPWIETDVAPAALQIETRVNGQVRQKSNTHSLIFDVPFLLSYLSACMTLEPGDVIFTGTPSGVSQVVEGDVMEVCIEGIGTLRNPVAQET